MPQARWWAGGTPVRLVVTEPSALSPARRLVRSELAWLADTVSGRARSELARVHRAAGRPVAVSPRLAELVRVALAMAERTGGAVDPTVGAALLRLGSGVRRGGPARWGRSPARGPAGDPAPAGAEHPTHPGWLPPCGSRVGPALSPATATPSTEEGATARPRPGPAGRAGRTGPAEPLPRRPVGRWVTGWPAPGGGGDIGGPANWRRVVLDGWLLSVPPTLPLDLSAIGKAHIAQRCADQIARRYGCGVLVELGRDVATAGPAPGWPVMAGRWSRSLVPGTAIATSTGDRVIDPRTAAPVVPIWRSVTVVAEDCVSANAHSIAAVVRGAGAGPWLAELGLPALLVDVDGGEVVLAGAARSPVAAGTGWQSTLPTPCPVNGGR